MNFANWPIQSLNDIAVLERGKFSARPRNDPKYFGGPYPFIQTGDVANSSGLISTYSQTLNEEGLRVSRLFAPHTLFFTIAANIGDVAVAPFATACPDSLVAIIPRPGADRNWLFHALGSRKKVFEGLATQNAQLNINLEKLRPFELPVPAIEEQRAIAGALSDVDELIAGLERLIAKKRDIKQATMQQLLTGQTRLPGFGGKWESKRLTSLARITRGASPRPIDSPIWFDDTSTVGWVRISDVTKAGMFLRSTDQRLSPLGIKHSRPVPRGSLIMSICATVGRPVITQIDTCIHDGFVVFDELCVEQRYLYYVLKWIEPDWRKQGQTGSQMNLNTGLINGTSVPVAPTAAEQRGIGEVLSDLDADLLGVEAQRDKTRLLKQGMMQELLTGKTRLV